MEYANASHIPEARGSTFLKRLAAAEKMFDRVSDRATLVATFEGEKVHVQRRDGKPLRLKTATVDRNAELRAAREKVARVRDAGSKPYVDAMAKIRRAKAIAAAAWENG